MPISTCPGLLHGDVRPLLRPLRPLLIAMLLTIVGWPGVQASGSELLDPAARQSALNRAFGQQPEFLPVDKAFVLTSEVGAGQLQLRWEMPDGYYLYRERLQFAAGDEGTLSVGQAQLPDGKHKQDEYFGDVEVYYHELEGVLPLLPGASGGARGRVGVTYQGCADAGLCYPPETKWIDVDLATAGLPVTTAAAANVLGAPGAGTGTGALAEGSGVLTAAVTVSEESRLAAALASDNLLYALGLFFVLGIGLAFTPCVLPMVPILSSIIVGQGEQLSRARALALSLAYVLPMALVYALLGVLVGVFGAEMNLQAAFQAPAVLIGFALLFIALSFSMFGFYELQLPSAWQQRINALSQRQRGGTFIGAGIMGVMSALVVSPCVSAPLVGALLYISKDGDALRGGSALLALGLGMGAPLLLVGVLGAQVLPRAGAWMNAVKAVFGVLLLAVAVWLLERIFPASLTLLLWAVLCVGSAVFLGALDFNAVRQGWSRVWQAAGVLLLLWGTLLVVGAASGGSDPLSPLSAIASRSDATAAHAGNVFVDVKGLPELAAQVQLAQEDGRPVLVDFYADWCISCKVMERRVFPLPEVAAALGQFHLVRADVTHNDAADIALLQAYGLYGPPGFLLFDRQGRERAEYRIQGEKTAAEFTHYLQSFLADS